MENEEREPSFDDLLGRKSSRSMAHVNRKENLAKKLSVLVLLVFFLISLIYALNGKDRVELPFSPSLVNRSGTSRDEYLRVEFNVSSITPRCQPDDVLLFYILSTSSNFARRKNIRSSWGSKLAGTCFVFVVGNTERNSQLQSDLNAEQEKHRDLVQINHLESYRNVIYKEVAALLWSARHYRTIPYLFKTDDDLIVDSILVASIGRFLVTNEKDSVKYISKHRRALVDQLIKSNRTMFFRGGWDMSGQPTQHGDGKFGVDPHVWPEKILPPYCSGFGWLMSSFVRDQLVRAAEIYPRKQIVWIGDVFLSGFVARAAQVRCSGMPIDFEQVAGIQCPCSFFKKPMLTVCSSSMHAGGGAPNDPNGENEFADSWKVIRQRHDPPTNATLVFRPKC